MTGWPAIFRRVDRAEDAFDQPRDDQFDFTLPCYCYGVAERDENLAYWVPRITSQCREHDGVARPLPKRRRNRGILPHFWNLGLSSAWLITQPGKWRLTFHCGCLAYGSLDPADQHVRPTHVWVCGAQHRGYELE